MAEAYISEITRTIEFLEVHEGLIKKLLSIDDAKFTLNNKFISSSLLASLRRHRGVVKKDDDPEKSLECSTLDRLIVLTSKVAELEKRMQVAEAELRSKVVAFEESRR
ncbi:hypothetical protein Q9L58_006260 [Maublancomyces gigas]|uniref:Uncharacterized protein n=1 Tax=Discina gigas TaxID=1032678 RepID=A0ABR3GGF0_9PEZI